MDLKDTYNKIAQDWHVDHLGDGWWVEGTKYFASLFRPGDTILDAGCAGGEKSKFFVKKGLKAVGFDFSENMVEIAKSNVPEGRFFVHNIYDADSIKEKVEGVFVQAVLLHIPKKDIQDIFGKLVNLLKPGGYIYVAVKEANPGTPEEEVKKENGYGYEYERFFSYYTVNELEKILIGADLKIVFQDEARTNNTNWLEIIGKK